jgi:hypothetical protein
MKSKPGGAEKNAGALGYKNIDKPLDANNIQKHPTNEVIPNEIAIRNSDSNLSAATLNELDTIDKLDHRSWERIEEYAQTHDVEQIKGKIAEELYMYTPEFQQAMDTARIAAIVEGIPPTSVEFVRDIRGVAPKNNSRGTLQELTDGAIVAVHGNPSNPKLRIFAVFESKSPGNKNALHSRNGEMTGQPEWDFERFREVPTVVKKEGLNIDDHQFAPENVQISRCNTEWYGVLPPSTNLSDQKMKDIQRKLNYKQIHGPVSDTVLRDIAKQIKKQADAKEY